MSLDRSEARMLEWFYNRGYQYIIRDMDSTLYVGSGLAGQEAVFCLGQLPIFLGIEPGEKRYIADMKTIHEFVSKQG